MTTIETKEVERLGRALAEKAQQRDGFIAQAFAVWRERNFETLEQHLGCDANAIWRLAVTPKPADDGRFVERAKQLAAAHGADPIRLVKLLRAAAVFSSLRRGGEGGGMLKAALDADPDPSP